MKKFRIILILALVLLIFSSKINDYKIDLEFYKKQGSFKILEIKRERGVKVYYTDNDFFFLDTYEGNEIKSGYNIVKTDSIVKIYNNSNFVGEGKILKPAENYFQYFFEF